MDYTDSKRKRKSLIYLSLFTVLIMLTLFSYTHGFHIAITVSLLVLSLISLIVVVINKPRSREQIKLENASNKDILKLYGKEARKLQEDSSYIPNTKNMPFKKETIKKAIIDEMNNPESGITFSIAEALFVSLATWQDIANKHNTKIRHLKEDISVEDIDKHSEESVQYYNIISQGKKYAELVEKERLNLLDEISSYKNH